MMDSLMLRTAARVMVPLQMAFSVFVLLRGHNEPGGGFIGGLVAACAILLQGMASGWPSARKWLLFSPTTWLGIGLLLALASGLISFGYGFPFMTAIWGGSLPMPLVGGIKIGTPFFFDIGVYCVVLGFGTLAVLSLAETDP